MGHFILEDFIPKVVGNSSINYMYTYFITYSKSWNTMFGWMCGILLTVGYVTRLDRISNEYIIGCIRVAGIDGQIRDIRLNRYERVEGWKSDDIIKIKKIWVEGSRGRRPKKKKNWYLRESGVSGGGYRNVKGKNNSS